MSRGETSKRPGRLALTLVAAALVAGATLLAYSNALDHQFVGWDDPAYVAENPLVQEHRYRELLTTVISLNYHPLTMVSLAANASWPLSAKPFILTNIVLHAINSLLAFWLALLLSGHRLPVAACVGLLFGIHPMHVESVAWISERKDVLYALFFLAGAIAYWRYLERQRPLWLAVTFALFVLSCLSKGMAVAFPLVLVLLDFWKGRSPVSARAVLEKVPFLAVAILFGLVAVNVQAGGDVYGLLKLVDRTKALTTDTPFTTFQRISYPSYGHMMYVWKLFVPVNLSAFYPYPDPASPDGAPRFGLAPLFLLATIAVAAWGLRRSPVLAFGIGWYLATVAMVLQWIPVGAAIMSDRYTYVSYFGLFFVLGMAVSAAHGKRRRLGTVLWTSMAAFSLFLYARTVRQVEVWRNSGTLWSAVIRVDPNVPLAYVNRGLWHGNSGHIPEALSDLQTARRLGARRADLFEGLGNAFGTLGRRDSALAMFDEALRIDPGYPGAYYNRGITLLMAARPRDALADLDRALQLTPLKFAAIQGTRGYALMQLGNYPEATTAFSQAVAAGDTIPDLIYNRGLCRLQLGDRPGAWDDFRLTLRLAPDHAGARTQLAQAGS
jgi:protein O-mannosyl-transferase